MTDVLQFYAGGETMSRCRSILSFVLTIALVLGFGSVAAAASAPTGDVIVGCNWEPSAGTLDLVKEDGSIISMLELCFEGLVTTKQNDDGSMSIVPCLASEWSISEDNLTYTFKLVPDVKFADGTPVTADDWIWSLERARDTKESPWQSYADPIKEITSPDANTLVITLKQVTAPFLSMLAVQNMCVHEKALFDKVGEDAYSQNPMGTGPFYVAEWALHDYYLLKANPYFRTAGVPKVASVRFNVVPDDNTRIMQLQAGDIDVCLAAPYNRIDELKSDSSLVVTNVPSTQQRYINFNTTVKPFDDARVRQALRLATKKDDIIKMAMFGYATSTYNVFPSTGMFWNTDLKDPGYDPDGAKKLLADAGYPDGFTCEINYANGNATMETIATVLKQQWAQVGVTLNIVPLDSNTLSDNFQNLKFNVIMLRWSEDSNDPAGLADFIAIYENSDGFHTGYKNDKVAELDKTANSTTDDKVREQAYHEMQQILFDDCPLFPLFRIDVPIVTRSNIQGFEMNSLEHFDLSNLTKN
jgi:peptide/nickel transport system substrate-binding protein